jgi:hypothetical protein
VNVRFLAPLPRPRAPNRLHLLRNLISHRRVDLLGCGDVCASRSACAVLPIRA